MQCGSPVHRNPVSSRAGEEHERDSHKHQHYQGLFQEVSALSAMFSCVRLHYRLLFHRKFSFSRFRAADPQYLKLYTDEVAAFEDRLRRRAKEKRDAALAEFEAEEKVLFVHIY